MKDPDWSDICTTLCLTLILVVALLTSGCAANTLRVTEYSGSTLPIPGMNAAAGGCQVSQEGEVTGRLVFVGEHCQFDSQPATE